MESKRNMKQSTELKAANKETWNTLVSSKLKQCIDQKRKIVIEVNF